MKINDEFLRCSLEAPLARCAPEGGACWLLAGTGCFEKDVVYEANRAVVESLMEGRQQPLSLFSSFVLQLCLLRSHSDQLTQRMQLGSVFLSCAKVVSTVFPAR